MRTKGTDARAVHLANHFIAQSPGPPDLNIYLVAGDLSSEGRSRLQTSDAIQALVEPFECITMHNTAAENRTVTMTDMKCPTLGIVRNLYDAFLAEFAQTRTTHLFAFLCFSKKKLQQPAPQLYPPSSVAPVVSPP
jgi:hypothetical protein